MINIVIIADKARLSDLKGYLPAEKDITLLHASDNLEEATPFINKAQVIIVDFITETTKSIVQSLKAKKAPPVIAIVDTAPLGFSMMEWGAADMHLRTAGHTPQYSCKLLAIKIRNMSKKEDGQSPRILKNPNMPRSDKIIAIGSSTGGTETVEYIFKQLPEDIPPILLVQHMPPIFTRMFAERLHNSCRISVWEAREGDPLRRGLALIAPGDKHMVIDKRSDGLYVSCVGGERVCNQRPAVDVLFESMAKRLNKDCQNVLGVVLTGMGSDGANGLLALRNKGSSTIGQDKESCVVYGMPRAAYEIGAVQQQLHLNDIASAIINFARK